LHIEWATNTINNEIISATLKVFLDFHPIKTLTIGMVQIESGLLLNRFIKTETLIFSWSLVTMSGFSQSKDSSQSKSNEMSGEKRPTNEQSEFPESKRSRNVTEAVKNVKSGKAVKGLPTRAYLDSTVVPILLEGLAALSRERPEDPIDYLIGFLQKHKKEHSNKELGLKN
jgi:protein dpy-30